MHFRTAEGERQSSAEGDPGCGAGQAGAGAGGEEARGGDQEGRQDGQQAGRHRPRQAAHQRQETENKDIQYDQQGKEYNMLYTSRLHLQLHALLRLS